MGVMITVVVEVLGTTTGTVVVVTLEETTTEVLVGASVVEKAVDVHRQGCRCEAFGRGVAGVHLHRCPPVEHRKLARLFS
jgi:hypothetical protein